MKENRRCRRHRRRGPCRFKHNSTNLPKIVKLQRRLSTSATPSKPIVSTLKNALNFIWDNFSLPNKHLLKTGCQTIQEITTSLFTQSKQLRIALSQITELKNENKQLKETQARLAKKISELHRNNRGNNDTKLSTTIVCGPKKSSIPPPPPPLPPPPIPSEIRLKSINSKASRVDNSDKKPKLVTVEQLTSVKLRRRPSTSRPDSRNEFPVINLNDILMKRNGLKRVQIERSPGGTPLQSNKRRLSGGEGVTPMLTRALEKRFQQMNPVSPQLSNASPSDSSFN